MHLSRRHNGLHIDVDIFIRSDERCALGLSLSKLTEMENQSQTLMSQFMMSQLGGINSFRPVEHAATHHNAVVSG